MNRDGARKSLWQAGQPVYEPINSWKKDKVYDVIVVGGGITGLTTALLLQKAGKHCVLAEAHEPGFGTTGGTTAHLNTLLDSPYNDIEKDFSADAAKLIASASREAIEMIAQLIHAHQIDCDFAYKDAFLFAQNEKENQLLTDIKEASQRAGIVIDWADEIPVAFPFTKAIKIAFQAQLHSTNYIYGLAKAFELAGGVILEHCVVQKATEDDIVTAETSLGVLKGNSLMYATHIPPGINLLHFRCAPYRSYATAFRLTDDAYPDALVYDLKDPYNYYRTQEVDGVKYIIAGGFDHKTGHDENTEKVFTELDTFLHQHFNIESVDYKWSSQYYNSVDGLPYIGLLPGYSKIYVGTGYSGNGMVLGTLAGMIVSDLILEHANRYADLLKPSRIKPVAGFVEFVKENADVVSQFIGKRFAYEKISSLAELAKGEAKLAEWEGKKAALYKDGNGNVKALDPVCPHAGCIVTWNNAEKSWDCPCHGGRFAANGDLLSGPPTKNLTSLLWEEMEGD